MNLLDCWLLGVWLFGDPIEPTKLRSLRIIPLAANISARAGFELRAAPKDDGARAYRLATGAISYHIIGVGEIRVVFRSARVMVI